MIINILGIVMKFFYNIFNDYGIAILLFTILSKIIIFPISILVQKNSIKLVTLKPKINKIKIDNLGDESKIAELESELYKKEKYNPFLSVVPLILQLIILIVLINIINNPITYISNVDNNTKELLINEAGNVKYKELEVIKKAKKGDLQNSELKNLNLSFMNYELSNISIDIHNYLFPFLAAVSALIYCFFSIKYNVLQKEEPILYNIITTLISVLLSLYLGLYVPLGVALYWVFSNLFAVVQLLLLNIIINPKKYINYSELERTNTELCKLYSDNRNKEIIRKEKKDYKRFFSIDNKHLVVYAENSGYYKYFKGIIEYLLDNSNLTIHYITSDYCDEVLNKNINNFKTYYIGEKRLIPLMMKVESDIVLMTVPDLDRYHIKRSYVKKNIEYIFIPHGIGNHNVFGKKGGLNHFDTIFVLDKYQKEEMLAVNKVYGLTRKVVELGYPLLDEMIKDYKPVNDKSIIIAPSWQKDSIMDLCIRELIDKLSNKYKVIVRPHPQYIKHNKNKILELKEEYKNNSNILIQDDHSTISNILNSEILITDWSGIAYEYAYITNKPVVFINTPMKVLNKDYKELGIDIFELNSRNIIGKTIDVDEIDSIDKIIKDVIKHKDLYSKKIDKFFNSSVYNIGNSSEIGAKYIVNSIKEKIKRREHE